MGRLFDAVASLAGVCHHSGYEGQPAMELEALLDPLPMATPAGEAYAFAVDATAEGTLLLDPAPVLAAAVRDVVAGTPAAVVSARFHTAVAAGVFEVAQRVRAIHGVQTVGLTGGVFQNAALTFGCQRLLGEHGFEVLVHRRVPPNDGGLALGQVVVAACGAGRDVSACA
jgi:hydrogenase maturation protein HypF